MSDHTFASKDIRERKNDLAQLIGKDIIRLSILSQLADNKDNSIDSDINTCFTLRHLPELTGEVPIFNYPDVQTATGDFLAGVIHYQNRAYVFAIREQEMIRHLLFVGSTGSGKTNLTLLQINQFLTGNIPFLVIDWKRNYRDIITIPEAQGKEILTFTVGREVCPFHFNPLIPPKGTSPYVWLSKIIEIMSHAYFLGEGVAYILSKAIDSVYREFSVYDGNNSWPSFRNVFSYLENYECKGRETQWLASALRAVAALCFGEMDRILNHGNYPIDELLRENVILEVDALTDTAKVFLTESLLLLIHHFRMAEGKREVLKHVCIIEEAHHILSRKLQMISGTETITDILLREVREFGESVIVIDQDPSLLSIPALGNTYTTVCFSLKERSDINVMASALNLNIQNKDILTKLEVGQAIVKLQGRWPEPFMITVPKVDVKKGSVTDGLLKQKMARFYEQLKRLGTETQEFEKIREIRVLDKKVKKQEEKTTRKQEQNKIQSTKTKENNTTKELTKDEREFLIDILKNPLSKVTERYKRLGLNEYQGNKVQSMLLEKELVRIAKLSSYKKRGYWGKTFELTKRGRAALELLDIKIGNAETMRKGGIEHKHLAHLIIGRLKEEGHTVAEEFPLGSGKTTDILVDNKIAIEIQRSTDNLLENVEKNLNAGFPVIVISETQQLAKKISSLLDQHMLNKPVKVTTISEILRDPNFFHSYFSSFSN